MNAKLRFINASIRTPATSVPYKSLNFAAVDAKGVELKDANGNVIRVTRGAPCPEGTELQKLATTMRGVRVEDGIPAGDAQVSVCIESLPVTVKASKFAGGDMTYVRNHEFSSITVDAEIEPIIDGTGKAMVSEKRDNVAYAYYKLVRSLAPAQFHVSMFGVLAQPGTPAPTVAAAPTPEE